MLPAPATENQPAIEPFPIREALIQRVWKHGAATLSDAELIAILIRTGDGQRSVLDIAHSMLGSVDNRLLNLCTRSNWDIAAMPGMSRARAASVIAALELGRRRTGLDADDRVQVTTSATAFELLRPALQDLPHEEFHLLLVDRGNRLISKVKVSQGGVHGTVADPKVIFKVALEQNASSVVLAHNHPSGQLRPSEEDIKLTRKLVEGGRIMDITVNDHVIVAQTGYFSFADNGML